MPGQHHPFRTAGGPPGADQHADAVPHDLRCQRLSAGHDRYQLGDCPFGERDVGRFTREGHRVAPHMQVGVQDAFEGAQILVGRTEQAHHEVGRNIDAATNLRRCVSSAGLAWRHVAFDACFLWSSGSCRASDAKRAQRHCGRGRRPQHLRAQPDRHGTRAGQRGDLVRRDTAFRADDEQQ